VSCSDPELIEGGDEASPTGNLRENPSSAVSRGGSLPKCVCGVKRRLPLKAHMTPMMLDLQSLPMRRRAILFRHRRMQCAVR
jgi:hypothetical protein